MKDENEWLEIPLFLRRHLTPEEEARLEKEAAEQLAEGARSANERKRSKPGSDGAGFP